MLSSTSSPSNIDTLDIDQYINYDPSPILDNSPFSPETSRSKSIPAPLQQDEYPNDLLLAPSNQQTFAGPSHQYELHKQQTGLPVGALANTLAVNQSDHIVYGHAQRMFGASPVDGYFGANTTDDFFDFNAPPLAADMDIDFASPLYDTTASYIDPNAVGGLESSRSTTPQKQRAWPGMHQQQAAQAKAQAQAQAQQQRQQPAAQQQNPPSARQSSHRPSGSAPSTKDPIVEERISRLLNQMRHSSVASSNDDAPTPTAQGTSAALNRAKKDEEDMDEDEKLLASEEGKKLSSKERRQLRNKVSARAFRSRRKEYIGQLEGEIAAKTAEANELRAKNEELMSENSKLTDLTRMLLESPAFSSFLNNLSGTSIPAGTSSATAQSGEPTPKAEEPPPEPRKDVNPYQPSLQDQGDKGGAQVGVALMPDTYYDYNMADSAWVDTADTSLYDAQVYAVTSVPEGPAIDHDEVSLFSGKHSSFAWPFVSEGAKHEFPAIEHPPLRYEEAKAQMPSLQDSTPAEASIDELDPSLALYDDVSSSRTTSVASTETSPPNSGLLENTPTDGSCGYGELGAATVEKFLRFRAAMEAPSQRVASVIAHMQ
ncbi:MAG: hypothetical protein Q9219_000702 [cf. Caloplaca sp. 3 TL-2023]